MKSGDINPRYTCNLGGIRIYKDGELEKMGFKRKHSDEGWFLDYCIDNATQQQIEELTNDAYVSEVMDIIYSGEDFERICISALEEEIIDDDGHYAPRGVLIGNTFVEFASTEALSQVGPELKSIDPRPQKQCFQTPKALLPDPKSIALRPQKHCSQTPKALIPDPKSNAPRPQKHSFKTSFS